MENRNQHRASRRLQTGKSGRELGALADTAKAAADRCVAAIDTALAFTEASTKRMVAMEATTAKQRQYRTAPR